MAELYSFPEGGNAIEWPGVQIGISNVVTRTRSRTKEADKTIDGRPGTYEELIESARRVMEGPKLFVHDVVIHGVRVRAHTNSHHLNDFWRQNWFGVEEWRALTGTRAPEEPQVTVYAFGDVEEQPEAAYYSREHDTIIFFNTSYYGQLKSWVLGAVGRILAEEMGIHSIHGAGVSWGRRGVLYIAPTGTGKSTSSYGMMDFEGTRFHSDDWVYLRYCYPGPGGEMLSPQEVEGEKAYRTHQWLQEHRDRKDVTVQVLSLQNERFEVRAGELDLDQPAAYAFISEKVFYLRSNIVESFPQYTSALLASRLENVPEVSSEFVADQGSTLDKLAPALGNGATREMLLRLYAFENARAMLDVGRVFGRDRIFANPMEPMKIDAVILLKRNFDESDVLTSLPLDRFCSRLMVGLTPEGKREIAYNAYRAVDDEAERGYMDSLLSETETRRLENVYRAHKARLEANVEMPETFYAEFELFRILHGAARAYDLNTTLQKKHPHKRDAVLQTMRIIARTLETLPADVSYDMNSIEGFVK